MSDADRQPLGSGWSGEWTVVAICYKESNGSPPSFPKAVTVRFDSFTGPTLSDGRVSFGAHGYPLTSNVQDFNFPLKLTWAIAIHKSQGMTLDKVVVDVG